MDTIISVFSRIWTESQSRESSYLIDFSFCSQLHMLWWANALPKTSTQFCAFKSGVKYLHRSENPFLHPYLISSLHTFEACSKSVQNDIILFSTFCQTHWQASRPSKSLTETVATLKIDGLIWRHVVLVLLWEVGCSQSLCYPCKTESVLSRSLRLCCKFLTIILTKRMHVVRIHHHWFRLVLQ